MTNSSNPANIDVSLTSEVEVNHPFMVKDPDTGKLIVAIKSDGNVKLGEGVTVDEASEKFYKALEAVIASYKESNS